MKKIWKILLLSLAAIFLIIQFIPFGKPTNQPVAGNDLLESVTIPEEISTMIKHACYDCHSQFVRFPWYSNVAPVSWLVAKDVNEGRENLDFSQWGMMSKKEKLKALDELSDEVGNGSMPLKIYTFMHVKARLTKQQRDLIVEWAENMAEQVFQE